MPAGVHSKYTTREKVGSGPKSKGVNVPKWWLLEAILDLLQQTTHVNRQNKCR